MPELVGLGLVVLLVGLVLRLILVGFGLPDLNHPDEPTNINVGVAMAQHGSLTPGRYNYPSFLSDVVAVGTRVHDTFGSRLDPDTVAAWQGFGIGHTDAPGFVRGLRLITVGGSLLMCLLVAVGAARVTGRRVAGLVAGLLLAVSPLAVESGVYITPDTWSGLFCAAALLGALAVYRRGSLSAYLLCGAAVGAAAGSKYNAALVGIALLTAFVLRRPTKRAWLLLLAAAVAAVAVFVLTTPGAIIEPGKVFDGVVFEARHYQKGHPGYTGSAFVDYLGALLRSEAVAVVLALVGLIAAVRGRWRGEVTVVGVFAIAYFGLVSVQNVHFDRNLLPVLPAVALLAGFGVAGVLDRLAARPRSGLVGASVVIGLLVVAGVAGIRQDLGMRDRIDQPARVQARAWLATHLPVGAPIVRESYGPWLDSRQFPHVTTWTSATKAYLPPHVAAVVLTHDNAGRYLDNPTQYPIQAADYRRVEGSLCRAVRFDDGPWIEILVPCR
jgi:hypothetical protein